MIRQRQLIAIVFAVLLVGLLYPSPAYAKSTAGRMLSPVQVKAGTPVVVLGPKHFLAVGRYEAWTEALVILPNGKVVRLSPNDVNYQTQTVRVNTLAPVLAPGDVKEFLGLPGTGGAALLPLVGAVMLIGGGLILSRLLH